MLSWSGTVKSGESIFSLRHSNQQPQSGRKYNAISLEIHRLKRILRTCESTLLKFPVFSTCERGRDDVIRNATVKWRCENWAT